MTFQFEHHCMPVEVFKTNGAGRQKIGRQSMLTVLLALEGSCSVFCEGNASLLSSGDFLVAGGQVSIAPIGNFTAKGILFKGAAPEQLASSLAQPFILSSQRVPGAKGEFFHLLETFPFETKAPASTHAYSLLCYLSQEKEPAPGLPPLVAAAIAEIQEHYNEVYGVEELASSLNVSKSHLIRTFTAATGVSPGRYLTSTRVEAAKNLLLHREYSLEVVATLSGFSGSNYLCKVFKKETGITPAAWRKQNQPEEHAKFHFTELEGQMFL